MMMNVSLLFINNESHVKFHFIHIKITGIDCQGQNGGENESLRDYYLSNPSLDVNPVDKKDKSLDGKISADQLERLLKNNNEHHPSGIKSDFSYRHESISAKINPDGVSVVIIFWI